MSELLDILCSCGKLSSLQTHILPILSDFNFVENVLSQARALVNPLSNKTVWSIGPYLAFILRESKVGLPVFLY